MATENTTETWKPVIGSEGRYDVSTLGRVRSLRYRSICRLEPLILKPALNPNGYATVVIGPKRRVIHRLVLEAFIGPCPERLEAAHNNGIRTDNRLENLRWATRRDNHGDKRNHGTDSRGERHPQARLTSPLVREILRLRTQGSTAASLAAQFGVSDVAIRDIYKGRRWSHATGIAAPLRTDRAR